MTPTRWLPDVVLPAYAYVPRLFPHPHSDTAGHGVPDVEAPTMAPDPVRWDECRPYLLGLDLFNAGYYWEAHEAWESLWHACGRSGPLADFFKGLIQLAVVGVKLREGRGDGAQTHAARAEELFRVVSERIGRPDWFGLDLVELIALARQAGALTPLSAARMIQPVEMALPCRLAATRERSAGAAPA